MTDPDIIDQVIERIETMCPDFATVGEAWFAAPIDHFDEQTPACLVYLAEDGAEGDAEDLRPVQQVTLTYGVWLVCPRDQFRARRADIRRALFGYAFTGAHTGMAYRGGQTTDIRGEYLWWRELWTVDTWLRTP